MHTSLRWPAVVLMLAFAVACSDSPARAVDALATSAEKRKLVQFRARFTPASVDRLRRIWSEDGVSEGQGWVDLMNGYVGSDREHPEVLSLEEKGEALAVVRLKKTVQGEAFVQDLTLVRGEDEFWRLELAGMKYQVTTVETSTPQEIPKKAVEHDDLGLGSELHRPKDFDLEEF